MQTRKQKERILAEAVKRGYINYYWFVRIRYKMQEFAGGHPGSFVPVIPVAPDPEVTRHYAHMLLELFKMSAASARMELQVEITHKNNLEQAEIPWYEYGDNLCLDAICYNCAQVSQVYFQAATESWLCAECSANYVPEGI